ncbi:MAG: 3-oxoacyl-[acyl-carrier-protein] reductase [Clostridiales bacterium]|nr:3-oxoacyl-[acyl-carrier-protein] reductase [Clostridiales bacterium]
MLHGKIAMVTGASKGIGREIAITLANNGATVIVNYNGSQEKAKETCDLIESAGGTCEMMKFSVADSEEVSTAVKDITAKYGGINILVNNAGITRDGLVMKMSEEDFDSVIATNLKGTFNTIKAVSRQMMKAREGRIINISSVSGVLGNAGQANYAASKAGVIGLTKSMARELSTRNITVNAIAPGFITTDMTEILPEDIKETVTKQIPLGHFGTPKDIAEMVTFLASGKASYITGQVICVDGGMAM